MPRTPAAFVLASCVAVCWGAVAPAAVGQVPFAGQGRLAAPGPYLAPFPPPAAFPQVGPFPPAAAPVYGPFGGAGAPFHPPAWSRPSRYATPPRSPFGTGPVYGGATAYGGGRFYGGAPVLPVGAVAAGPSQASLYRPSPHAAPTRLEPVAREATVGRVSARRYDYSFEVVPPPAPAYAPAGNFRGNPGGAW